MQFSLKNDNQITIKKLEGFNSIINIFPLSILINCDIEVKGIPVKAKPIKKLQGEEK